MIEPLVPADVNLRGLPWMRLDTERLLNSDLFALATGDEFKAAVALWCKSWSQLPAGSLPKDDRILAGLSGAGGKWKRIRERALHGWVEATDGRLYHQVVAEQVKVAWEERVEYRAKLEGQAERKRRERDERAAMFGELKRLGHDLPWNTPTTKLRELLQVDDTPDLNLSPDTGAPVTVTVTAKTGRDGTVRASTPDTSARSGVSEASADDLARALQQVGFPDCSATLPDLVAAMQEGVTPTEVAALAVQHAGKPLQYVIAKARGRRQDAAQRATAKGEPGTVVPIDPKVKAQAQAKHDLDAAVIQANSDFSLGVIKADVRDQRIADARDAYRRVVPTSQHQAERRQEGARA